METKICTKCGINKPLSEFCRYKRVNNDNYFLRAACKECYKAHRRQWAKNNRDKLNALNRKYYRTDPNMKVRLDKYNSEHREEHKIYYQHYKQNHPESYKAKCEIQNKNRAILLPDRVLIEYLTRYNDGLSKEVLKQYPELINTYRIYVRTKQLLKIKQQ